MNIVIIVVAALAFFVLIMLSIALHEIGHLVPAKLFGVKVKQYFVGFGKTLWSRKWRGTEYGIKAIPLGGYVRLIGMYPPGKPGTGWLSRLANEARQAEAEDISPADDGTLLYQKKSWQKIIVMLGGPMMNILLAFLIFWSINVFHGQYRPQLEIAAVSQCLHSAQATTCKPSDPLTPAKEMGIKAGDVITSFNGVTVSDWSTLSELIRKNGSRLATITVRRDGREITLPSANTRVTQLRNRLDPAKTVSAGFLGVVPSYAMVHAGPITTLKDMWVMTEQSVVALIDFPEKVWQVTKNMVSGKPRNVDSPISIVGASIVAGEVAANNKMVISDRIAFWFSLLGSVNLFVGLLNLVPLVPLDGGHVAGAIYEWLKRLGARLLGRTDPGPADTAKMLPVAYLVGGFLLLAGVALILADIFSPVKLF